MFTQVEEDFTNGKITGQFGTALKDFVTLSDEKAFKKTGNKVAEKLQTEKCDT